MEGDTGSTNVPPDTDVLRRDSTSSVEIVFDNDTDVASSDHKEVDYPASNHVPVDTNKIVSPSQSNNQYDRSTLTAPATTDAASMTSSISASGTYPIVEPISPSSTIRVVQHSADSVCRENTVRPQGAPTTILDAKAAVVASRDVASRSNDPPKQAVEKSGLLIIDPSPPVSDNVMHTHSSGQPGGAMQLRMGPPAPRDIRPGALSIQPSSDVAVTGESYPTLTVAQAISEDDHNGNIERDRIAIEARNQILAEAGHAEPVEDVTRENNHQRWCFWGSILCVLLVASTVSITLATRRSRSTATKVSLPTAAPTMPVPTSSPIVILEDGRRAFTSTEMLRSAVDQYQALQTDGADLETTELCLIYGCPIGTWDVSRVVNFDRVFDPDRNQALGAERESRVASSFDEDLSGWDVSNATSMVGMFAAASEFSGKGLQGWNVARVADFSYLFAKAFNFVGNVSGWNTSSATKMEAMFSYAAAFNGDVSQFIVSKVYTMSHMFEDAVSFVGGDLRTWDVSKVTDMSSMFLDAKQFSGLVSTWDTSKVTNMYATFSEANVFQDDLSGWSVSKVNSMKYMFSEAERFVGGNLTGWNTSRVTDMYKMFFRATTFNGNISNWDVSTVTDFTEMFSGCDVFNGDLSQWKTTSAVSMTRMFHDMNLFSSDLSRWDTGKVERMDGMFQITDLFNHDLSGWNVFKVTNAQEMFDRALSFNHSLCSWGKQLAGRDVIVSSMFTNTSCLNQSDPVGQDLALGPYCTPCDT